MTTKEIATIDKKVTTLVSKQELQAEKLEILKLEDMTRATELLSEVNRMADKLEEERTKLTVPLNATLKEINNRYKPLSTTLKNAVDIIRKKMMDAQKRFDADIEGQKDKLMDRVERGTMRVETAVAKMEDIPDASAKVLTDSGAVQWVTVKKLVIDDATKIPREYLDVNETAVKEALKNGIVVPGARMIEEKIPKNTR